jgi:hypothetical protein
MNTNAIIGVIAAVIVVGGGAWYLSQGAPEGGAVMNQNGEETEAKGDGTFASLLARTGSWKCDVTTTIEEAPSTGTALISDGKIRADFTSVVKGQSFVSHMIHADGYVYTWTDSYPQGMKMKIPEGSAEEPSMPQGFEYNSQVDYDCSPWMADVSVFTAPSSVSFMELDASMMAPGIPQPN